MAFTDLIEKDEPRKEILDELHLQFKQYASLLLKEFEEHTLIKKDQKDNKSGYSLVVNTEVKQETKTAKTDSISFYDQLNDFRNLCISIYHDLGLYKQDKNLSLENILKDFSDQGLYKLKLDKSRKTFFQNVALWEKNFSDEDILKKISEIITEAKINFLLETNKLLERYGRLKVESLFKPFDYEVDAQPIRRRTSETDVELTSNKYYYEKIFFEFIYRRGEPTVERSMLAKYASLVKSNPRRFLFIIVFTKDSRSNFEKSHFDFLQKIERLTKNMDFPAEERIAFIPVSTSGLNQFKPPIEEFIRDNVQHLFSYHFKNDLAPFGNPDRNDHIFDRLFSVPYRIMSLSIDLTHESSTNWCIGLIFSETDNFPDRAQPRHISKDFPEIYIVSKMLTVNNIISRHIELKSFQLNSSLDKNLVLTDSLPQTLDFIFESNFDSSKVNAMVEHRQGKIIRQTFDLEGFKYCKLFAWSEQPEFEVHVKVFTSLKSDPEEPMLAE